VQFTKDGLDFSLRRDINGDKQLAVVSGIGQTAAGFTSLVVTTMEGLGIFSKDEIQSCTDIMKNVPTGNIFGVDFTMKGNRTVSVKIDCSIQVR